MNNTDFTKYFQDCLDKFLKDLSKNKNLILNKIEDFKGNKNIVRNAIKEGIEKVDKTDTEVAKTLFNFVEFYSTGNISRIDVNLANVY